MGVRPHQDRSQELEGGCSNVDTVRRYAQDSVVRMMHSAEHPQMRPRPIL